MELESLINDIKIPTQDDKIYKDESIYDYDTPESEDGLFVCLKTFYGVGKNSLKLHYERTQSRLYLLMKKLKIEKEKVDETEEKPIKITKLAIGVEGGFNPNSKNYSFEEQNTLFLYPECKVFDLSDENVPDKIKLCVANILSADSAFIKEQIQIGTWDGEKRRKTKFADLKQLDNGIKIPPKNWKCSQCDKRDNLWLNLTDGEILCGRKNFDGTGGNNHAVEHYAKTNYPLAVKLGTITPQNSDVYSYPEDDMVEDPNLEKHLLHFGININNMEKTEKTMIELEIDANKKVDEWLTIQEANSNLIPIYGSGYTGIENLGNSCYLNSVIQVLFAIPEFKNFYYPPDKIFLSSRNPINDLDFQLAKVANGLISSHYSKKPSDDLHVEQKGIRPSSFKTLVGKNHPEFSTKRQQDAQEFFLHIIDLLEKSHKENNEKPNLTEVFKFKIEDKIQCLSSNKVSYTERSDYVLSLPIPLEKTLNPEEVEQYLKEKEEANMDNKKVPKIVRPKINLLDCINQISNEEIIDDFMSPETKSKTTAKKVFKMKTFPDYLMLHMQKYTLDNSWQPKKIDCHLELPEVLDLSFLRGHGLQPGEELLPESSQTKLVFNEEILNQLVEMGFGINACKRSLLKTKADNVEIALNWLFEHQGDSDFNNPIEQELSLADKSKQQFVPDPQGLEALMNMGLSYEYAVKGLKETNNNVENALDWIFTFQNELSSSPKASRSVDEKVNENFKDGSEKYKLFAFISHMGPSTQSGHYVCHILKDDKWIIHNDSKIAVSVNPPVNLAYMYLFKRI